MFCQIASAVPRNQLGPRFIAAGTGSMYWSSSAEATDQERVMCRTSEVARYCVRTLICWKRLLTRFESTKSISR